MTNDADSSRTQDACHIVGLISAALSCLWSTVLPEKNGSMCEQQSISVMSTCNSREAPGHQKSHLITTQVVIR